MKRDEVIAKLRETRAEFDRLLAGVPADKLGVPAPGGAHTPAEIALHVAAYDDLMVKRLRAAREGESTAFDRDRDSWEAFNERIWAEAASVEGPAALAHASETFLDLLEEIGMLSDDELASSGDAGVTAFIDQGWLQGRTLAEVIGVDGFDHYPMHYDALEAAASSRRTRSTRGMS